MTLMTDKQYAYIVDLLKSKDYAPNIPLETQLELMEKAKDTTSRRAASEMIAKLLEAAPRIPIRSPEDAAASEAIAKMTEGYFELEGDIYRVRRGRLGRLYASILLPTGKFEYSKGSVMKLALANAKPLSLEEAEKLGRIRGRCIACGLELTNPKSIARGIGPVCATKF